MSDVEILYRSKAATLPSNIELCANVEYLDIYF